MNMQKVMLGVLGACAALVVPLLVIGQAPQTPADRPLFVAEESWVPLSPDLGLVLTNETVSGRSGTGNPGQMRFNANPATGYFMAKIDGTWRTVYMEPPVRAMPAQ